MPRQFLIIAFNKYFSNPCSEASGPKCSQRTRGISQLVAFFCSTFSYPTLTLGRDIVTSCGSTQPCVNMECLHDGRCTFESTYGHVVGLYRERYTEYTLSGHDLKAIYENMDMSLRPYMKIQLTLNAAAFLLTLM